MHTIDITAVIGSCPPERASAARRLAEATDRHLVTALRVSLALDPIAEAFALAARGSESCGGNRREEEHPGVIVEFPEATDVAELISRAGDEDSGVRLRNVVCIVDAAHLRHDIHREDYVVRQAARPNPRPRTVHVARSLQTVTQIEYASRIVLVGWTGVETYELALLMALVSHLSPHARLQLDRSGADFWRGDAGTTRARPRPGWTDILNGEHLPHMTDRRVSALRYENHRPLHPGRLRRLIDGPLSAGELGDIIRSVGFCRFATRPAQVAQWDHVGQMISFHPLSVDLDEDEVAAVGQDLAFVGVDLDHAVLTDALDGAALTDGELAAGPTAWRRWSDPFPDWSTLTRPVE